MKVTIQCDNEEEAHRCLAGNRYAALVDEFQEWLLGPGCETAGVIVREKWANLAEINGVLLP